MECSYWFPVLAFLIEFINGLKKIQSEKDIRVIIITGSGEKAFIAGANFSNFCPLPNGLFRLSKLLLKKFIFIKLSHFINH